MTGKAAMSNVLSVDKQMVGTTKRGNKPERPKTTQNKPKQATFGLFWLVLVKQPKYLNNPKQPRTTHQIPELGEQPKYKWLCLKENAADVTKSRWCKTEGDNRGVKPNNVLRIL